MVGKRCEAKNANLQVDMRIKALIKLTLKARAP